MPGIVVGILSFFALFIHKFKDIVEMVKWLNTGAYVNGNTQKQKELFGDLPTVEEAVKRYCKDKELI